MFDFEQLSASLVSCLICFSLTAIMNDPRIWNESVNTPPPDSASKPSSMRTSWRSSGPNQTTSPWATTDWDSPPSCAWVQARASVPHSTAAWVMHMSKRMINMITRAFIFSLIASMGFTRLPPVCVGWFWQYLLVQHPTWSVSSLASSESRQWIIALFPSVGFTSRIFYRTDAGDVILKRYLPVHLSIFLSPLPSLLSGARTLSGLPCRLSISLIDKIQPCFVESVRQ